MGFRQIRTSDLTGNEIKEEDVITVNVKNASKVFDATAEELSQLKRVNNIVELEYRHPDGNTETVLCTQAEFNKVVPPEKLETFDNSRGRRTGYSPATKNGG